MRAWLRSTLPRPERLASVRGLGWLAPLAARRELWRLDRRAVALGLAIGAFLSVALPIGQLIVAIAVALAVRANLPAAALGTLLSNPLTIAPLYAAAYALGAAALGLPLEAPEGLAALGKPLLLGAGLLAVTFAAASWLLVQALWRLAALRRAARWSTLRKPQGERT